MLVNTTQQYVIGPEKEREEGIQSLACWEFTWQVSTEEFTCCKRQNTYDQCALRSFLLKGGTKNNIFPYPKLRYGLG